MLTFKQFIAINESESSASVAATKRKGITHFHKMKPVDFIDWAQSVKGEMKGILKNIKVVLKVDGIGFRFGLSSDGKVFVEGSRTGPITDDGAFSKHAMSKTDNPEIIIRSRHYDDILTAFKRLPLAKTLPLDTKIECELFYNPMAEQTDSSLKFVTVKYDKNKLGSLMTILPYKVLIASTGEDHPDNDKIIGDLLSKSNGEVKIIDPTLKLSEIDINTLIKPIDLMNDETKRVLTSRKAADKEEKAALTALIQRVKDDLTDFIMFNKNICGLDKICSPDDNEGIVLHLPSGMFKMTSKKFQDTHK